MKKIYLIMLVLAIACTLVAQTQYLVNEDFEGASSDWTIVNGTSNNKWSISPLPGLDTRAAFISNTGGAMHQYDIAYNETTVHVYRSVTFPAATEVQSTLTLSFDVIVQGESFYDFLAVFMYPETSVPTANNWEGLSYMLQSNPTHGPHLLATLDMRGTDWVNIELPIGASTYAGQTRLLTFSWRNDSGGGTQPPAAIDNVVLSYEQAFLTPLAVTLHTPLVGSGFVSRTPVLTWAPSAFGQAPTYYKVYLDQNPDPVTEITSGDTHVANFFQIQEPLGFYQKYYWKVVPYNADGASTDTPSVGWFTTTPRATHDIIGGTWMVNSPVRPYYRNSYSQTIYLEAELGRELLISEIGFQWNGGNAASTARVWEVFMGITDVDIFTDPASTSLIPMSELESVFDGTVAIAGTQMWVSIPLDTPFEYSGSGNLVIAVWEKDFQDMNDSFDGAFLGSSTGSRTLFGSSGSTQINPIAGGWDGVGFDITGYANLRIVDINPPVFAITPDVTSHTFTEITIPDSDSQQFSITNGGGGSYQVESIEFVGDHTHFTLTNVSGIQSELGYVGRAEFTVGYTPNAPSGDTPHTATLKITVSDPIIPGGGAGVNFYEVALTGTAILPPGATFNVNGRVINATTSEALSGVTVSITGDDYDDEYTTDATGMFAFGGCEPGEYTISFVKEGFVPRDSTFTIIAQNVDMGDIAMSETIPTYTVSGIVINYHTGTTLAGVEVTLTGTDYSENLTTQANGLFSFDDCLAGEYTISFVLDGFTRVDSTFTIIDEDFDMGNIAMRDPNVSDEDLTIIPTATRLGGNYPNPFNPSTTIRFDMVKDEAVSVEIYNVRGQKIKTLVNDVYRAGSHSVVWNGTDDNGSSVGSGVYFYRMQTDGYIQTKRMLLLK